MKHNGRTGKDSKRHQNVPETLVTVVLFIIYMFPFSMIVLNAFKHKRDIIKMPLSWGGKKGFTTDNFVDAFQQMNYMNILKNSLIITCGQCVP